MVTSCSGTTCTVPSSSTFTTRQRTTCPSGKSDDYEELLVERDVIAEKTK
jgi:hypothetical protein